jgi:hypothetical protein
MSYSPFVPRNILISVCFIEQSFLVVSSCLSCLDLVPGLVASIRFILDFLFLSQQIVICLHALELCVDTSFVFAEYVNNSSVL